jgi:DNA-directed RNA polymerase alpha subunit
MKGINMKDDKEELIKIIESCDNEEDLEFLKYLITDLFKSAKKYKNEQLQKTKSSDKTESLLKKYLKSFSDFPNVKNGHVWNYIEKNLNIYTVDDLIHTNPGDIMKSRGFGKKRMEQLEEWMAKYNLTFISR